MAGPARNGLSGLLTDVVESKRQELEQFLAQAEAAGRQAYDATLRFGEHLLPSAGGGLATGFGIAGPVPPFADGRSARPSARPASPPQARSQQRRSPPPPSPLQSVLSSLDHSHAAKAMAGDLAMKAGWIPGMARGVWHTAEGLGDTAIFARRLADPMDLIMSPPGQSAWSEALDAGNTAGGYLASRATHPDLAMQDIADGWHRFRVDNDPTATPQADTFIGEMKRRFGIGQNQGETALNFVPLPLGAAELKGLSTIGKLSRAELEAKYLAAGLEPRMAEHFAQPYKGSGHHTAPKRLRLPAMLGGGPIPSEISDSPMFLLRPKDISNGEFYKLHHGVDPFFHGGRLPGGGGWSAKKLGWTKYGPAGRLWFGTTTPMKATIGAAAATGQAVDAADQEGQR